MRYYLISDNIDTLTGMRLVGIEGTIITEEKELSLKLDEIIKDKSIAVLLITEQH